MRCIVLGSGSKGNATLVEAGQTRILIDNGFSGKELLARLHLAGIDPPSLSAVLITHEHNDHIGGVGVLARRLNLPVYANVATTELRKPRYGKFHKGRSLIPANPSLLGICTSMPSVLAMIRQIRLALP